MCVSMSLFYGYLSKQSGNSFNIIVALIIWFLICNLMTCYGERF